MGVRSRSVDSGRGSLTITHVRAEDRLHQIAKQQPEHAIEQAEIDEILMEVEIQMQVERELEMA